MNNKLKNILWGIFAVALVVVAAVWFLDSDIEPIPDTNGPGDRSLTTITDENIINRDMGALHPITVRKNGISVGSVSISSPVEFSSKDFSGVYEVCYNNFFANSDVEFRFGYLNVESGNFKMVVLLDNEIVGVIEPSDEEIVFSMEDVNGYVSLRIAGESAAYSFTMSQLDYDYFVFE